MEKIREEAAKASSKIVPQKSKSAYDKEFNQFSAWCSEKKVDNVLEEDGFLAYFLNVSQRVAPSSMWTKYSMLKSTLKQYKRIDISKYTQLTAFLKSVSKGYKPKKSKILEREHIEIFLKNAPIKEYLLAKVALIIGISGACRCDELVKLTIDNVHDRGAYFFVSIPDTKTYTSRSFTIIEEGYPVNALNLIKKYLSLRPKNTPHRRFFVYYQFEKCTIQPVGINKLLQIPRSIAKFLQLPELESYTGHCMRRSSATLLANAGGDIIKLKQLGGWKSTSIAEGYIEESVSSKIHLAKKIQGSSSTSIEPNIEPSECVPSVQPGSESTFVGTTSDSNKPSTVVNMSRDESNNCLTFTININISVK